MVFIDESQADHSAAHHRNSFTFYATGEIIIRYGWRVLVSEAWQARCRSRLVSSGSFIGKHKAILTISYRTIVCYDYNNLKKGKMTDALRDALAFRQTSSGMGTT